MSQSDQVGVMETTYVSMTNSPTNQLLPTAPPDAYLSVRVTTPHHFWSKIEKCVNSEEWYISWKENGKSGSNPHFHVLVSGSKPSDAERIRKRLKVAGYSGNRELSVKFCQNGLLQGIQYCGKEGPPHEIGGDKTVVQAWIDSAPEWQPKQHVGAYLIKEQKKPRNPDHFFMITYQNLEKVTLRYHKEHGIASDQLEQTLASMHKDGWRCSVDMLRRGIPQAYYDQFTAAVHNKSIFTANRFLRMRIPENWN